MKKLFALLLSVLVLCSMPLSAFAEETADDGRADSKAIAFFQYLNETDTWSIDLSVEDAEEPVTGTLYKNGDAFAADIRFMGILTSRVVYTEKEAWVCSPLLPFFCSTLDPSSEENPISLELPFSVELPAYLADTLASDPDLIYTCEEENGIRKETFTSSENVFIVVFEGDRVIRIEDHASDNSGYSVINIDRFETSVPSGVFRRPPIDLMVFANLFSRLFQRFFSPTM